MMRKLVTVATLSALLVASVPALAESLSASNLPACCNSIYCPMRRHQARDLQKDTMNCDPQGNPARNSYSMRACDPEPPRAVGTAPFILVAPLAMRNPTSAEPARVQATRFFPAIVSIPLTPPPRTLPS